ncbi:hypothetical protein [Halalkalibacter oceani]|uniref:hypothetical protein n=1 Tax=Halalkalibacter oceani TaxID=1653776 RepID=UPI00339A0A0F
MAICTVCNGMSQIDYTCPACHVRTVDFGKIMDYEDSYRPYEEIEVAKAANGIANDREEQLCPHYMICPACSSSFVYQVKEQ